MAIPGVLPPDADFGEPLADHEKVAKISGASHDSRKLVVERNLEFHISACRNGRGKLDLHYGAIGRVVVVGMCELHLVRQVAHAGDFEMCDRDRTEMLRLPFVVGIVAAMLGHEDGLGLKGVQIQVKWKGL